MVPEDAMPPSAHPDTRFTYEDFLLFPDDGKRHEIIDGEHYVTAPPVIRHQRIVQRLGVALTDHLRTAPAQAEVFFVSVDVVLSWHDVVVPDVVLVTRDQASIIGEKNL